uniref:Uncharacterized protein n=1 Tax=Oryza glumipatula TaxID=40148 RepID=A0A0E0BIL0_9ORYZ
MGPLVNLSFSVHLLPLFLCSSLLLSITAHLFQAGILFFAPAKEAASTGLLSTRWRSLWRSTGAVNLAVRPHHRGDDDFSLHDAFVRSTHAALADMFLHRDPQDWERKHDVVAGVVSHPVARRVEELPVAAVKSADGPSSDKEVAEMEGEFHLSLRGNTQPSETLRVLDVTGCGSFSLSAGGAPAADDAAATAVRRAGQGPAGRRRLHRRRSPPCTSSPSSSPGRKKMAAPAPAPAQAVHHVGVRREREEKKRREREELVCWDAAVRRRRRSEPRRCAAFAAAPSWPSCLGSGRPPSRLAARKKGKEKKKERKNNMQGHFGTYTTFSLSFPIRNNKVMGGVSNS